MVKLHNWDNWIQISEKFSPKTVMQSDSELSTLNKFRNYKKMYNGICNAYINDRKYRK
jgi:hypothetical protein